MFKIFFVTVLYVVPAASFANSTRIELSPAPKTVTGGMGGGSAEEMLNNPKSVPTAPRGKSGAKLVAGCTNRAGTSFSSGDAGYSACLAEVQASAPNPNASTGAKPSVGFKIGD